MIVSLFEIQASSYPNDDKLDLDLEQASLMMIFEEIESISDYRFLFETQQIVSEKRMTVKLKDKEIKEVLDVVLDDTGIKYKVKGRQVILVRTEKDDVIKDFSDGKNNNKMVVQQVIKGTVSDAFGPLLGANVLEKGTTNGVQTDFDGNYTLNVSAGAILVVSYVGYKTKEVPVSNQSTINITLEEDAALLEEVVVTALGISREKKSLGYATQEVSGDDVNRVPTDNVVNALSGKVSGVQIKNNSNLGGFK